MKGWLQKILHVALSKDEDMNSEQNNLEQQNLWDRWIQSFIIYRSCKSIDIYIYSIDGGIVAGVYVVDAANDNWGIFLSHRFFNCLFLLQLF